MGDCTDELVVWREEETRRQREDCVYNLLTNNFETVNLCCWVLWCAGQVFRPQGKPELADRLTQVVDQVRSDLCPVCACLDAAPPNEICLRRRGAVQQVHGDVCVTRYIEPLRALFAFLFITVPEMYGRISFNLSDINEPRARQLQACFPPADLLRFARNFVGLKMPVDCLAPTLCTLFVEKIDLP